MYAIVRSGGRQHKVAVGDIVEVDKIPTAKVGDTVSPIASLASNRDRRLFLGVKSENYRAGRD